MSLPKKTTFVTFDCYGTLIDWEQGIFSVCSREAEKDGFDLDRDRFMTAFYSTQAQVEAGSYELYAEVLRRTVVRAAKSVGWDLEPSRAGFLPASVGSWPTFKDTEAVVKRVAKDFQIGLLSNIDDKLLGASRRYIPTDFDLVITAQQVRTYKPDPSHFKECARRVGGKKGWVHVTGSYETDVLPCVKEKIPVIWVNREGTELEARQKKPTAEVKNLREAAKLLKPAS